MHGLIKEELKFVKNLGLNNYKAIQTATLQAAKACRIDNKLGTLEKNKIADVLVIKDNPVDNLDNLDNILAIFKDGKKIRG